MKLKVAIGEKVAWVRSHPVLSLAISGSSFLLFSPRVQSLLIFFWPLLLSTALFVAALLTIGDSHKPDDESFDRDGDPMTAHLEENGYEEVGECSVSTQHCLERQRSLIDYVVEQHEGSIVHFDSLFDDSPQPSRGVVDPNQSSATVEEEDRRLKAAESSES